MLWLRDLLSDWEGMPLPPTEAAKSGLSSRTENSERFTFLQFLFCPLKNPQVRPELGENLQMQLFPCTAVATCGVQCPLDTSRTSSSAS